MVYQRLLMMLMYLKGGEVHFSGNSLQTAFGVDEKLLEESPVYSIWVC
jgi:predicted DNA-binding transcriptional regulator YafY